MNNDKKKLFGMASLLICAVCLFVAIERYNDNAEKVRAINSFQQSTPFGGMLGGGEMKAATPAVTKYALLFASMSGIGGAVLLLGRGKEES